MSKNVQKKSGHRKFYNLPETGGQPLVDENPPPLADEKPPPLADETQQLIAYIHDSIIGNN